MRVLHVTDAYLPRLGGIELHVRDLADAQRAAGDDVDILTLTRARVRDDEVNDPAVCRPAVGASYWKKAGFVRRHRVDGAAGEYDVVHAHCSTFSTLAFATAHAARVPTLITVHSLWRRYTAIYRTCDVALGWSRWPVTWSAVSRTASDAVSRAAAHPLDVSIVPNGVDVAAWQTGPRAAAPDHLRMVSVMRLAPRKRPLPLLRVLRAARRALPPSTRLSAAIIGDGPERPAMERYLQVHGMTNWVTLTGQLTRPQIATKFAAADLYIAPATLESFGIAALEARAAGLPVLGRCCTGLSDFVVDGVNGRLVDGDRQMADAIVTMATGGLPPGAAGTDGVQLFSWPAVVERTRDVYLHAGAKAAVPAPVDGRR